MSLVLQSHLNPRKALILIVINQQQINTNMTNKRASIHEHGEHMTRTNRWKPEPMRT